MVSSNNFITTTVEAHLHVCLYSEILRSGFLQAHQISISIPSLAKKTSVLPYLPGSQ